MHGINLGEGDRNTVGIGDSTERFGIYRSPGRRTYASLFSRLCRGRAVRCVKAGEEGYEVRGIDTQLRSCSEKQAKRRAVPVPVHRVSQLVSKYSKSFVIRVLIIRILYYYKAKESNNS